MFDTMMQKEYKGTKLTNGGDLCLPVPTAEKSLSDIVIGLPQSIIARQSANILTGLKQNVSGVGRRCRLGDIFLKVDGTVQPHVEIRHIGKERRIDRYPSPPKRLRISPHSLMEREQYLFGRTKGRP